MAWKIPLSDVPIDEEAVGAATDAMRSGWWSMGPRVEAFEEQFASFCGLRHAFAVSNGTSALHAALLAVGCGPGDTVVLPSLTFVAAANTVVHTGARPVFSRVERNQLANLGQREPGGLGALDEVQSLHIARVITADSTGARRNREQPPTLIEAHRFHADAGLGGE